MGRCHVDVMIGALVAMSPHGASTTIAAWTIRSTAGPPSQLARGPRQRGRRVRLFDADGHDRVVDLEAVERHPDERPSAASGWTSTWMSPARWMPSSERLGSDRSRAPARGGRYRTGSPLPSHRAHPPHPRVSGARRGRRPLTTTSAWCDARSTSWRARASSSPRTVARAVPWTVSSRASRASRPSVRCRPPACSRASWTRSSPASTRSPSTSSAQIDHLDQVALSGDAGGSFLDELVQVRQAHQLPASHAGPASRCHRRPGATRAGHRRRHRPALAGPHRAPRDRLTDRGWAPRRPARHVTTSRWVVPPSAPTT